MTTTGSTASDTGARTSIALTGRSASQTARIPRALLADSPDEA